MTAGRSIGLGHIGRELALLLALKAVALGVLWLLFFPDWRQPVIDDAALQHQLLPSATVPAQLAAQKNSCRFKT